MQPGGDEHSASQYVSTALVGFFFWGTVVFVGTNWFLIPLVTSSIHGSGVWSTRRSVPSVSFTVEQHAAAALLLQRPRVLFDHRSKFVELLGRGLYRVGHDNPLHALGARGSGEGSGVAHVRAVGRQQL